MATSTDETVPKGSLFLPPDPDSIKRGRHFIAGFLTDDEWSTAREAAVLLVSELVTNAVLHSASPIELTITTGRGKGQRSAMIRVTDADTGPIVTRGAAERLSEGGRGIFLVDRLAATWGTEHAHGQKSVWFTVTAAASDETADAPGTETDGAPMTVAATPWADIAVTQRRMATLVLAPALEQALSATEQLIEILDRILAALDGNGITLTSRSVEQGISLGRLEGERNEVALLLGGHSHGNLTLFSDAGLDEDGLAFLRVAGERLAVMLAANSLVSAARERQGAQEFISEATELLAGARSLNHTLSLAAQMVVPDLAEWCIAYSTDERGVPTVVTAMHTDEIGIDTVLAFADADPGLADTLGRAVQSLHLTTTTAVVGGVTYQLTVVPLVSRREPSGLLVLGTQSPLDPATYVATAELGRRVSMAADNARLHDRVTAAATALQTSLLPPTLPNLNRIRLGARYRASSPTLAVGGDFYDAFALPDGSSALAIGDVCGRGAEAAAVTRTTRDLLRLMLRDGASPAEALRRLNQVLLDDLSADRFCTVAVARLSTDELSGLVHACICLAGHPEPMVVRAGGSPELVGTPGGLLGILPAEHLVLHEEEVDLDEGDLLILYTDGVTEARSGDEMFGQDGLARTLRGLVSTEPQAVADAIESAAARFTHNALRDDMAVLVAELSPPGSDPQPLAGRSRGRG